MVSENIKEAFEKGKRLGKLEENMRIMKVIMNEEENIKEDES